MDSFNVPSFARTNLESGSRDAFDLWFKAEMLTVTGLDLNNPPPDTRPAELLSHYETASLSV